MRRQGTGSKIGDLVPLFLYEAVDLNGKRHKGRTESETGQKAADRLKHEGLVVLSIKKQSVLNTDIKDLLPVFSNKLGVSKKELALFCRQISFLLSSGADMGRALHILSQQGGRPKGFTRALSDLGDVLLKGENLSDGMGKNPCFFPPLLRSMTNAGEVGGNLELIMARIAEYYENEHAAAEEIKNALLYPIIISIMMLCVIVIALIFVVPSYSAIYASEGVSLPIFTRILIFVSNFLTQQYLLILPVLSAVAILVAKLLTTERGIYTADWCKINVKPWSVLNRKAVNLRFSQTLALLLGSGVHIIPSMDIVRDVISNKALEHKITAVSAKLAEGSSLSDALEGIEYFEPMLCDMVSIGEDAGCLPDTLLKCAVYFQDEYNTLSKRFNRLIEPCVTIVLGLVMAFIMLAVMLPTFSLTDIF